MTAITQQAFVVWWKDLERWVVPRRMLLAAQLPNGWSLVRVGQLIRRVEERVRVEAEKEYKMVGVKWYGEGTFHRETVRGDSLSATYVAPVMPNAVIYNRLFAWKGSFAVVPEEHRDCFVSNEFPQFIVDEERILPRYLYLFFMCDSTIKAVNASSIGSAAVSRNRFKEDEFLDFEIPLPPMPTQRAIVAQWDKARIEIAETRRRVERLKAEIDARFFKDLGLTPPEEAVQVKCFGILWKDFQRWSVSYNQAARAGADLLQCKYPIVDLGSVLELIQYGTSEKANTREEGVPILRMNNIVDGVLDTRDLKYVRLPEKERARLLLRDGDILFNRTNSKELVGKCAVFHEAGDYIFASYLIRLRPVAMKVLPAFLAFVVNSPVGRSQIDALSRQIIGQANVNTDELRSLQIPVPPLTVQQAIMRRVDEGRVAIAKEREKARTLAAAVQQEVDEMILGTRPVPGLDRWSEGHA